MAAVAQLSIRVKNESDLPYIFNLCRIQFGLINNKLE